jgi:hypothetical protein
VTLIRQREEAFKTLILCYAYDFFDLKGTDPPFLPFVCCLLLVRQMMLRSRMSLRACYAKVVVSLFFPPICCDEDADSAQRKIIDLDPSIAWLLEQINPSVPPTTMLVWLARTVLAVLIILFISAKVCNSQSKSCTTHQELFRIRQHTFRLVAAFAILAQLAVFVREVIDLQRQRWIRLAISMLVPFAWLLPRILKYVNIHWCQDVFEIPLLFMMHSSTVASLVCLYLVRLDSIYSASIEQIWVLHWIRSTQLHLPHELWFVVEYAPPPEPKGEKMSEEIDADSIHWRRIRASRESSIVLLDAILLIAVEITSNAPCKSVFLSSGTLTYSVSGRSDDGLNNFVLTLLAYCSASGM